MRPFALLDPTCMRSQSIHARGSLFFPCMRPFTRAAFYSTCLLSLPSYACDQIYPPRLFRLLLGTLSILQLSCCCSSLYPLVSKPAFNLHASMPVESKPFNHVHNRGFGGDGLLGEFNRLPHHTPGPGGIASLDPQTVLQYLTLCVTTIMRP